MTTRAADDFATIGARMRELEAERVAALNTPPLAALEFAAGDALDMLAVHYGLLRGSGEPDSVLRHRVRTAYYEEMARRGGA